MANCTELGRRIDVFVRELEEEFGELPESDEPLMTRIEDWAVEIGDAVMARAVERKLESRSSNNGQECCPTCGRPGYRKGSRRRLPAQLFGGSPHSLGVQNNPLTSQFFPGQCDRWIQSNNPRHRILQGRTTALPKSQRGRFRIQTGLTLLGIGLLFASRRAVSSLVRVLADSGWRSR